MARRKTALFSSLAALALACAALPAGAAAGFIPARVVDGPSADILSVGDVDIARDGQGLVGYLRRDQGVSHAFVSRFQNGAFNGGNRIDTGIDAPASEVVVSSADGGRMAAAFVSEGTLFAVVYNPKTGSWTSPQVIGSPASAPSLDLSIHGAGFLTYTSSGDVRAARLERNTFQFAGIAAALDLNQAATAGEGNGRSRVAIGADSTAVAVWGEEGRVGARRLYRTSVSTAPVDLGVASLEGRPGGAADLPEVSIEDDSSFAQVVFRQAIGDQTRVMARRMRGSKVEDPVLVDGLAWGAGNATGSHIDLNGRGEGTAATTRDDGSIAGAVLKDDKFNPGVALGAGSVTGPLAATSETSQRVVGWFNGTDATARARFYEDKQATRVVPTAAPEVLLSSPGLGPVDTTAGSDLSANRVGDFMNVFIQGTGASRALVYAVYDRAPVAFSTYTRSAWRNPRKSAVSWSEALDLWGGVTYSVQIGGREIVRTRDRRYLIPETAGVADGVQNLKIVAIDQNGQTTSTPIRPIKLDSAAPTAVIELARKKRTVTATVVAADVLPPSGRASGIKVTTINFGDGMPSVKARSATKKYLGKKREFTITANVTDNAGNRTTVTRTIKLPKPPKRRG